MNPQPGRPWEWAPRSWAAVPRGRVDHLYPDCRRLARARMFDRWDGHVYVLGNDVCRACRARWTATEWPT